MEEEEHKYKKTNKHFKPKINVQYGRYCLKIIKQEDSGNIVQLFTLLRKKVVQWKFNNEHKQIRNQIVKKQINYARKFEKGFKLTLNKLRTIASTMELSEMQAQQIKSGPSVPVHYIKSNNKDNRRLGRQQKNRNSAQKNSSGRRDTSQEIQTVQP